MFRLKTQRKRSKKRPTSCKKMKTLSRQMRVSTQTKLLTITMSITRSLPLATTTTKTERRTSKQTEKLTSLKVNRMNMAKFSLKTKKKNTSWSTGKRTSRRETTTRRATTHLQPSLSRTLKWRPSRLYLTKFCRQRSSKTIEI